jgi:hypothetical protein
MKNELGNFKNQLLFNHECLFRAYYRTANLLSIHKQGGEKNIYIFSTPRRGSTLLMEMIGTQSNIRMINEPLYMDRQIALSKLGDYNLLPPHWDFLLPNKDREQLLFTYFRLIEQNKVPLFNALPFSSHYAFRTDRIVFKILRVPDMINWFEQNLNSTIVFLIRHPIANSLSRKRTPELRCFLDNEEYVDKYLDNKMVSIAKRIMKSDDKLSKAVLDWCIRNVPPLRHLDRRDWIFLTYEELIRERIRTVDLLADRLSLRNKGRSKRRSFSPSGSSSQSDSEFQERFGEKVDRDSEWFISRWKNKIDDRREMQLFRIIDAFEIDIYTFGHTYPSTPYLNF